MEFHEAAIGDLALPPPGIRSQSGRLSPCKEKAPHGGAFIQIGITDLSYFNGLCKCLGGFPGDFIGRRCALRGKGRKLLGALVEHFK